MFSMPHAFLHLTSQSAQTFLALKPSSYCKIIWVFIALTANQQVLVRRQVITTGRLAYLWTEQSVLQMRSGNSPAQSIVSKRY